MKVLELKTGIALDVNDSYGARMIEQGQAILAPKSERNAKGKSAKRPEKEAVIENVAEGTDRG